MPRSLIRTGRFILNHPIGKRNKIGSLSRWIRWQLGSRLLPFGVAVPFVGSTRLLMEKGMAGASGNFYVGLHEYEDMLFTMHFLRPEDLFLDVGANIGSYSVLAAGVSGASTVAFEPIPTTFAFLSRNIRLNGLDELVSLHQVGIGQSDGNLRFSSDLDSMNQVVGPEYKGETIEVPIVRLDDTKSGKAEAILWKIDVEGFEEQVLSGATESLKDQRLKAVFLEASSESLSQEMKSNGFARYSYDPIERKLTASDDSNGSCANSLWLRDLAFVEQRVKSADVVKLLDRFDF